MPASNSSVSSISRKREQKQGECIKRRKVKAKSTKISNGHSKKNAEASAARLVTQKKNQSSRQKPVSLNDSSDEETDDGMLDCLTPPDEFADTDDLCKDDDLMNSANEPETGASAALLDIQKVYVTPKTVEEMLDDMCTPTERSVKISVQDIIPIYKTDSRTRPIQKAEYENELLVTQMRAKCNSATEMPLCINAPTADNPSSAIKNECAAFLVSFGVRRPIIMAPSLAEYNLFHEKGIVPKRGMCILCKRRESYISELYKLIRGVYPRNVYVPDYTNLANMPGGYKSDHRLVSPHFIVPFKTAFLRWEYDAVREIWRIDQSMLLATDAPAQSQDF